MPPLVVNAMSDDVMRQFQQLMSQFLQTQAVVMTAYLQGAPAGMASLPGTIQSQQRTLAPRQVAIAQAAAPAPVAASAAPAVHVPPPTPVVAAKAPAVVVAQSVTVPAPAASPVAAPAKPAPAASVMSPDSVLASLLQIVSDRTGYPEDMLAVDANIEADLGIDSIKRMEILTAFQQLHAGGQRGAFQGAMEKLTAIKTLRETGAVLAELLSAEPEAAIA
jgi:hypothetical protein